LLKILTPARSFSTEKETGEVIGFKAKSRLDFGTKIANNKNEVNVQYILRQFLKEAE